MDLMLLMTLFNPALTGIGAGMINMTGSNVELLD